MLFRSYPKAPDGWCKHRLAHALNKRAYSAAKIKLDVTAGPAEPAGLPLPSSPIPAHHIVTIQGHQYVTYVGLLQLAHERGLVSLTADWTCNESALSLAHAVARFSDGRVFEECGDATPENTNRKVAAHFRRVALTRAKARVLRDALGVDLVAFEELSD